jgi:IclR family transcriptional regulator, pca regulon regulatory protein
MSTGPLETTRGSGADVMGGFAKGLLVIEAFGREHDRLTIADAARLTGLDRATARRCLRTLVDRGFATLQGTHYSLTARVLRLGYSYLAAAPLPRLVQPYIEALAAQTHESCSVCVLDGAEIVYVARASQRRVLSVGLSVGSRLPAFCASMGRVLLAALPETEARAVLSRAPRPKRTPHTTTTVAALMQTLAQVRARGYALVDQELELGLRSIAVPLRGRSGVVGAVNVGAQAARMSVKQLKDVILPSLRQLAADLAPQL